MKTTILKLNASFLLFILCFLSCNKYEKINPEPRSVILISPEASGGSNIGNYSGIIEEGKNVNASFMADGKIINLAVKEGDRVRKGQLIASLDDTDYQIGVNQLKAQFNQMTEEKKRMDEMYKRHNIAPNDYEKFITGYEQLKLQLEMAENKLSYTRLYSPTNGFVAEKFMEPGELVGAGTPVYKITDDSKLIATVDLPVSLYLNKKNIISAKGYTPALPDSSLPLSVESFSPNPDNNMLYRMKLLIPSQYTSLLTPGMNIRVNIETQGSAEEGFTVPARSVFENEGTQYVWVFNPADSTISKKSVTVTGNPIEGNLSVGGLSGDESIVKTGVKQLYEGEKVHIVNNSDFGL